MAPRSTSHAGGPSSPAGSSGNVDPTLLPSVSPGGTYALEAICPGCKIFVQKPDLATGDIEERRAEVLSKREKYRGRVKKGEAQPEVKAEEKFEYYVHYEEFNKRLDEWVLGTRLILSREIEWPRPVEQGVGSHAHGGRGAGASTGSAQKKKTAAGRSGSSTPNRSSKTDGLKEDLLRKAATKAATEAAAGANGTTPATPTPTGQKRKQSETLEGDSEDDDEDGSSSADSPMADGTSASQDRDDGAVVAMELLGDETMDATNDVPSSASNGGLTDSLNSNVPVPPVSKEAEIEKLRTSGSMSQSVSEVARVKNFDFIRMGAHEIETWYFSPYPVEWASMGTLYICEMCLSFYPSAFTLKRHRTKCTLTHPPGNEIYRHEDISFFEIDGRKQKTWCRNLCLLSKCFLDHKTLYYDVDPFLYYLMVQRDDTGCHIIGYFSKEKESAEGYNVACILTLPQHQRSGFGRLLIDFSYELSKREHKLGSPEKPLSDLGLLGYRAYWAETIVGYLLDKGDGEETSIDEVATKTCITHADVLHTCTSLNMLKQFQGKHYLVLNDLVLANHEKQMAKRKRRIKGENLNWIPPVFSRAQLQFGW